MQRGHARMNPVANTSSVTVLVVDDEVLIRVMLTEELRERGYLVVEAANADEALSVLHSDIGVDVVVTDLRMPGDVDGAGLARAVRAEHPSAKVVMLSGEAPEVGLHDILDGCFLKPCDFAELATEIETLAPPSCPTSS